MMNAQKGNPIIGDQYGIHMDGIFFTCRNRSNIVSWDLVIGD
jgi:hypothetical protein